MSEPAASAALNAKLLLLTRGMRCDFGALAAYPDLKAEYKVETLAVSDRHFISPGSENRRHIPDELILSDGRHRTVAKAYYRDDSPFTFTVRDGGFVIEADGRRLPVDVQIVRRPEYYKLEHNGAKLSKYVSVLGTDRVSVIPYDGCENWMRGDPCKFCGADPARLGFGGAKPNVSEVPCKYSGDYERWWAENRDRLLAGIGAGITALLEHDRLEPHTHVMMMGGNLSDVAFEWRLMLDVARFVAERIDLKAVDSYLILAPPASEEDIAESKRCGFGSVAFNLECYDERLFADTCPGKDRAHILDMLRRSVAVYGRGKVRTNVVLGIEPTEGLLEGAERLASEGIVVDYSVFFPRPASVWRERSPPSPDAVLAFTDELAKIYRKYGFRPFSCSMSSRSSVASDVVDCGGVGK